MQHKGHSKCTRSSMLQSNATTSPKQCCHLPHLYFVLKNLSRFLPCSTGCPYLLYPNSAFFSGGRSNGRWGWGDRTLGLFVKSFLPAFGGKTTQEHLFTSHRSARNVWVDSDILENFSQNGNNVIVAWSLQLLISHKQVEEDRIM